MGDLLNQHQNLICLDIETIPDIEVLPADADASAFPKLPHHKVVAISVVECEIMRSAADPREWFRVTAVRSGGREDADEAQLLRGFWAYFARSRPRVITWNGRGFDMLVLRLRAMIHGISAEGWHNAGNGRFSTYGHRYASDWHCDLMDVLGDHGAGRGIGLEEMARAMGLPGKIGGHGSEIADMIREGRIADVRAYCEGDVLNLFVIYVRWMLLTGRTSPEGHNSSVRSLIDLLARERAKRAHLGEFLDKWSASKRPMPMLVPIEGLVGTVDQEHLPSEHVLPRD